jgi:inorganic pyrophosphatase/exopolyphosphatase
MTNVVPEKEPVVDYDNGE